MVVDFRQTNLACPPDLPTGRLSSNQTALWRLEGSKIVYRRSVAVEAITFSGRGDLALRCFFQGTGQFCVDGNVYAVERGAVLATPKGVAIESKRNPGELEESLVAFFDDRTAELCSFGRSSFAPIVLRKGRTVEAMARLADRLRAGEARVEALHPLYVAALESLELDLKARKDAWRSVGIRRVAEGRNAYRRIETAREFVFAMYRNPIRLSDVANAAQLSQPYLIRLFSQLYGETPMRLVARLRFEEARRLLQETNLPIAEIGRRLSMESAPTFSTRFSKAYGESPASFRRRMESEAKIEEVQTQNES